METSPASSRSVDLTGLPEEAIQAVEAMVAMLRQQAAKSLAQAPYEEWSKAFREWVESHQPVANPADWSRESIYGERSE